MLGDNQSILPAELQAVRELDDFDLTMLLSEIHDHGWPAARELLPMMLGGFPGCRAGGRLTMPDWMPIDSAPKDKHILLFGTMQLHEGLDAEDAEFAFTGYWDDIDSAWCGTASTWTGPFFTPTHWQPLPNPPSA